jgi:hypothetical protein
LPQRAALATVRRMDADTHTHRWARIAVLRMLVRLVEQLRRGEVMPDDPPGPRS